MLGLISILLTAGVVAGNAGDLLKLEVIRHQPCQWSDEVDENGKPFYNWTQQIIFPDSRQAPLIEDGPGCYKIEGPVIVNSPIRGSMQLYVEVKHRPGYNVAPEPCTNYDPYSGCGGLGSCIYCDACSGTSSTGKVLQATEARIEEDGKKINCDAGWQAGVHKNVALKFCLPSREEFLKAQGISEDLWDEIVESRSYGKSRNFEKIGLFLTIRLFNSNVQNLMRQQRYIEKTYRAKYDIPETEPLPAYIVNRFPFNSLINNEKGFIACHRVFGNIYIEPDLSNKNGHNRAAGGGGNNLA
jgi:hypothetical protein